MNHDLSRGGFQNRDVGFSQFDRDYGPEYGIDFSQFSDAPTGFGEFAHKGKEMVDEILRSSAQKVLSSVIGCEDVEIYVKNGFLFLKGPVADEEIKTVAEKAMQTLPGLTKVINVLNVRYQ